MTKHPQVPCLDFECDEELAELLTLMNRAGIQTIVSCQDNNGSRGQVRRVWVEIWAWDVEAFAEILNRPGELDDMESLSNRMASEYEPDDDWEAFREDRTWHYRTDLDRIDGEIMLLAVSVMFPYTDLPEVVHRLRLATS